jgi:hypothetical protein
LAFFWLSKKSDPISMSMLFRAVGLHRVQMERRVRWVQYPYTLVSLLGLPVASFWYWPADSGSAVQLHAMLLTANPSIIVMVIAQILFIGFLCAVGWEDLSRTGGLALFLLSQQIPFWIDSYLGAAAKLTDMRNN